MCHLSDCIDARYSYVCACHRRAARSSRHRLPWQHGACRSIVTPRQRPRARSAAAKQRARWQHRVATAGAPRMRRQRLAGLGACMLRCAWSASLQAACEASVRNQRHQRRCSCYCRPELLPRASLLVWLCAYLPCQAVVLLLALQSACRASKVVANLAGRAVTSLSCDLFAPLRPFSIDNNPACCVGPCRAGPSARPVARQR
jgi:hypothetical protein